MTKGKPPKRYRAVRVTTLSLPRLVHSVYGTPHMYWEIFLCQRMLHFRPLRGNLIELTISEGVTPAIARDLEIFQKWYLGTYLNNPQRKSIEETFTMDVFGQAVTIVETEEEEERLVESLRVNAPTPRLEEVHKSKSIRLTN